MKKLLFALIACAAMATFPLSAAEKSAPKTIIHIVTVAWKEGTKPEQIQAALDGAQKLPQAYPGVLRVWTKALKVQNVSEAKTKKSHVIVMEFADEAAFKAYTDSAAQKEWYKVYLPIREQSTTFDVTN